MLTLPLTDGTLGTEAARVAAVEQYRDRLDAVAGTPWTLDAAPRPGLPDSLQALADGAPPAVSVVHRYHSDTDRLHPYRTGSFATGANMSFRTERFRELGGFDENLGPGTLARGGEDLDAPVRVLAAGDRVAFEPAAIGWHADRFDDRPFTAHLYTYGLGLTAFLAKHPTDRRLRGGLLRRIPAGLPALPRGFDEPDDVLRHEFAIPLRYHLWHLAGRAMGPLAYVRSRWSGSR